MPFFTDIAQISVANPAVDGTGSMVLVSQGIAAGKRVTSIRIKALGNTPDGGMINFFYSPDGGVTKRFFGAKVASVLLVILPGNTLFTYEGNFIPPPEMVLVGASQQIYASTVFANTFNLISTGITSP